jgi:hypothetical protein
VSRLLDKLKGAQRARKDNALLFVALKKAKAERDAARQADDAIAQASDSANGPPAPASDHVATPRRSEARTRAAIALLLVAAVLCAAVAWRGGERERPAGLKLAPALDMTRVQPENNAGKRRPDVDGK